MKFALLSLCIATFVAVVLAAPQDFSTQGGPSNPPGNGGNQNAPDGQSNGQNGPGSQGNGNHEPGRHHGPNAQGGGQGGQGLSEYTQFV